MEEQSTILETLRAVAAPPYKSAAAAFEQWWRNSVARQGRGGLTRKQVAEMAYGAGVMLGSEFPALAKSDYVPDEQALETLAELKERVEREYTKEQPVKGASDG